MFTISPCHISQMTASHINIVAFVIFLNDCLSHSQYVLATHTFLMFTLIFAAYVFLQLFLLPIYFPHCLPLSTFKPSIWSQSSSIVLVALFFVRMDSMSMHDTKSSDSHSLKEQIATMRKSLFLEVFLIFFFYQKYQFFLPLQ